MITEEHKKILLSYHLGIPHSEETKQKISESNKGKIRSKETRRRISVARKGKKLSEETKIKISKINKGKIISEETKIKISKANKGCIGGMFGKNHTEETKRKMSETKKGKMFSEEHRRKIGNANKRRIVSKETKRKMSKALMGENNHQWLGGISFHPYTSLFNNSLKEKIRNRDNRLCQLCGKTEKENGKKMAIHHTDYIKENCNEDNLLTLCTSCNGKVNFNRGFWTGFFVCYLLGRKVHE